MHSAHDTYEKLITLLDEHHATYRLIDHEPQGQTNLVSAMRGHPTSEAAKCIITMVKIGKKQKKYVLAVVPGDKRVNLGAIKTLFNGTYVGFASNDVAEALAASVSGTVLPFSFNPELELVVDSTLLDNDTLYFNAARLDRSIALSSKDYKDIAHPRIEDIIEQ